MYFSKICRLCLTSDNLRPIFTEFADKTEYSAVLYNATGIKIQEHDGLPSNICQQCQTKIQEITDFRTRCKESQELLTQTNENVLKIEISENVMDEESQYNFENEDSWQQDSNVEIIKNEPVDCLFGSKEVCQNIDEVKPSENAQQIQDTSDLYTITDSKRIKCKLCDKNLSLRSLDFHIDRFHPGANPNKSKCEFCDKYIRKEKMNRHRKMSHRGEYIKCTNCQNIFNSKLLLKQHSENCGLKKKRAKQKRSESDLKMSECDICKKKMQKRSLKHHYTIKHAGMGPICEHCGKTFGNKIRLIEHLRAKHGYEKLKCKLCPFETSSEISMQNHNRRHRGEKPFVCEICGAKFHAAYILRQHKHSHRTNKTVKCDLCPKTFKTKNTLSTHKQMCHNKFIFRCLICGKSFRCRVYTEKHLRQKHHYTGPTLRKIAKIDSSEKTDLKIENINDIIDRPKTDLVDAESQITNFLISNNTSSILMPTLFIDDQSTAE